MFTGIIETRATLIECIKTKETTRLVVDSSFEGLQLGESIAVNGVCLTLVVHRANQIAFDLSPETRRLTTLDQLQVGEEVNLERAMSATSRFGGHYLSGHVD